MLESIEKGRKLPQFGRSHNVAFFNKMHPLSPLAQCNPTEHFTVFCHLTLPASEGGWHCVPGVTKSLCVHTLVFTFLRGFEGRAALLFFSSPVTNGLWQAPRRSEQNLLELVGAISATCPWGWGQGGRKWFCMKASSDDSPLSPAETVTFQGTGKRPWLEECGSSLQGGGQGMGEHKNRSQKPLDTSASSQGLRCFPQCSSQSRGEVSSWENIFLSARLCIS